MKIEAGATFGRLTVIGEAAPIRSAAGRVYSAFLVKCACGAPSKIVKRAYLISRETLSCGCLKAQRGAEANFRHGGTGTPEHHVWRKILERCSNPKAKDFPDYGGRGIQVCERWRQSFEAFLVDMGRRPSPLHSIDRYPNTDGDYEPTNCRWATAIEQGRNKRNNRILTHAGRSATVAEWSGLVGIPSGTIIARLRLGWDESRALTAPLRADCRRTG